MRRLISLFLILCVGSIASAEVRSKKLTYKVADKEHVGYLAWDDAQTGPRPGVLVVHEWWGLNDYARGRADQLAKLGYVAFCADMYGDGKVVEHPDDAAKMAGEVRSNVDRWQKTTVAALDMLKTQQQCDKSKLAAIGYCFGGSTCLKLAYTGADLKAAAAFHAALPTPTEAEAQRIKATILVNHGGDDKYIPEDAIKAFKSRLDAAKVNYEFISYSGAVHSFTVAGVDKRGNPGMKYDKEADEKSWEAMKELFAAKLGK